MWIQENKFTFGMILYSLIVCVFIMGGFHLYTVKPSKKVVEKKEHEKHQKDVKQNKPARLWIAILSIVFSLPIFVYFLYSLIDTAKESANGVNKTWTGLRIGATGFKLLFLVVAYLGFFVVPSWQFYHTASKPMFMGGYSPVNKTAKRFDQAGQVMLFGFFVCAVAAVGYMMTELKKKTPDMEAIQYSAEIAFMATSIGLLASFSSLFTIVDKHYALAVAYSI